MVLLYAPPPQVASFVFKRKHQSGSRFVLFFRCNIMQQALWAHLAVTLAKIRHGLNLHPPCEYSKNNFYVLRQLIW